MSVSSPKVSIVTPTFNRATLLPQTIDSIMGQAFEDFEYIVIDDGSSDDTAEVVKQYGPRLQYVYHENRGEAFSTTRGWRMAKGEYFAMISSDDPMLPHWLSTAVQFMDANPNILVGYPDWHIIDEKSRHLRTIEALEYDPVKLYGWLFCLPGPGTLIRRSALTHVTELKRAQFKYMPDLECWLRLGLQGQFARIPQVLGAWRQHPESTSIAVRSKARVAELFAMVDEFYRRDDLPAEIRALHRMALSRAHYIATAVLAPVAPVRAIRHFSRSKLLMARDPVGIPLELQRRPLFSPRYLSRMAFWSARETLINRFRPQPADFPSPAVRGIGDGTPLVSVIVPTHNRRSMVARAVESATNQTYDRLEVIVVDDGSTDGTTELLGSSADSRVKIIRRSHAGVSAARNAGLREAKGTLVAFLDSDDLFHQRKLEICVDHLARYRELAFLHTYWADKAEGGARTIVRPHAKGDVRHDLFMFTPIAISTVLAQKSALDAAGPFDDEMRLAEDYDLLCRLALLGPAGLIEQPLTDKLIHPGGANQTPGLVLAAQLRILRNRYPDHECQGLAPRETYMANAFIYAALGYIGHARPDRAVSCLDQAIRCVRRTAKESKNNSSSVGDRAKRHPEQPQQRT